jgi:hypothetical protein
MRIIFLLSSFVACFIINTQISAQKKVTIPSDRKHNTSKSESVNYFFRGEFGAAYGKTSLGSLDMEGFMIPADLYIGIGEVKNTYIHAMVGINVFIDSYNTLGRDGVYQNSSVYIYDFGGGLTINAVPNWIYLSGSITGSRTFRYPVSGSSDAFGSKIGIGLQMKLGTSIMITRFFGIGLSGFIYSSMMNDAESDNESISKIRNNIIGVSLIGIIGKL